MRCAPYILVLLALAFFATPASAAQPLSWGQFWAGFVKFWSGVFGSISGVVGLVLGAGAVGIFIITRGKWLK